MRFVLAFFSCLMLTACEDKSAETSSDVYSALFSFSLDEIVTYTASGEIQSKISNLTHYNRVVLLSSPFYGFAELLNSSDKIVGVANLERLKSVSKNIKNVAYNDELDLELILSLNPDLIIGNSHQINQLSAYSFKTMAIDDFNESSPLKKASFVLLFGEIFNQPAEALSYFTSASQKIKQMEAQPYKVGQINNFSGSWFIPGCETYTNQIISMAGFQSVCEQESRKSELITAESAIVRLKEVDYLLFFDWNKDTSRIKERLSAQLEIKSPLNIIYCNTTAKDYFTLSLLRPDSIIQDLGAVLKKQKENSIFQLIEIEK